jgi:serine protease Do
MKRMFNLLPPRATWFAVVGLTCLAALTLAAREPLKATVSDRAVDRSARGASYAPVIKRVTPSVITIYSTRTRQSRNSFMEDPAFRRFFGEGFEPSPRDSRGRREEGQGSGVIVSEDGYILTNNHVIEGADADSLKITLADGKTKYDAKIVGTDPRTDLAVLKIEAKKLPAVTLADSDKLEVGDVVLAIGNPFGIGQSVSMGIISAVGRADLPFGNMAEYEDFIQTDAAINPGNSGGALVDAEGRLIGINQSIASPSGGNAGVGFAVPVNLARSVLERIVADGKVTRGYLGVAMQPEITPEIAREFNLPDTTGVLVTDVLPDTPAERAGIKRDDVIIEFNGKKVADRPHLRLMVSQVSPEAKTTIKILRDGKEKNFDVSLAAQPENFGRTGRFEPTPAKEPETDALEGVEVADLDDRARQQYEIPQRIRGALVTKVEADSTAAEARLRAGDVIVEINRRPVRSADDAVELTRNVKGDRVWLRVYSPAGGGSRYLPVETTKKKK